MWKMWKKLFSLFKKKEEWIEIKVPEFLKEEENNDKNEEE